MTSAMEGYAINVTKTTTFTGSQDDLILLYLSDTSRITR
ncbi:MAG: hypothetical protein QG577_2326 [Thermodesulfobacteriota bacterium]|nr:hypothetical protein [Thermodesulfobacteriota bacterium]